MDAAEPEIVVFRTKLKCDWRLVRNTAIMLADP
jgi:hypothetical protein